MNEIVPALLTRKQVAARLNMCTRTLDRLRQRDETFPKAVKAPIENKTLFKANDIEEYVARLGYV